MDLDSHMRVLVIDDDPTTAGQLARFLSGRYEVHTCSGLVRAREAHDERDGWRPHVLVLVPPLEQERHGQLEELRRIYPRLPVVVLTLEDGPELLLDLEAFAPTVPVRPSRGLGHIASAVAAASSMC